MNRVTKVLAVLCCLLAASFAVPSQAQASSERAAATATYVAQTRQATNAERVRRDIRALRQGACLQRAAQRQANRMARANRLFHSPDFGSLGGRCGLRSWGENVAYGGGGGKAVVRRWMASSGHRANILNRSYGRVGIAAVRAHGRWWAVQVFGQKM